MDTLDKKYDHHYDIATGVLSEQDAVIPQSSIALAK